MRSWMLCTLLVIAGALCLAACSDDDPTNPPEVNTIDPIANLSFERVDATMVALHWTSPGKNGRFRGDPPACYELLYEAEDGAAVSAAEVRIHTCDMATHAAGCCERYLFAELSPHTTYSLTVRAVDDGGRRSPESNRIEFTTPGLPEPLDPRSVPVDAGR